MGDHSSPFREATANRHVPFWKEAQASQSVPSRLNASVGESFRESCGTDTWSTVIGEARAHKDSRTANMMDRKFNFMLFRGAGQIIFFHRNFVPFDT